MTRKKTIAFFVMLIAVIALFPAAVQAESDPGELYIHLIEGDVQMRTADLDDWMPAAANTPLLEGDSLWVPYDARVDIHFRSGTSVRMGAGTSATIGRVEAGNSEVYLDEGHMYVNYRGPAGSSLAVYARDASFRLDGPAIFRVDVPENGNTEISAFSGVLYVNRGNGEMRINRGERVVMRDHGVSPSLTGLAYEDEWGQWNRQRDRDAYGRAPASAQYLPAELAGYSSDLDGNGRWVYTPDYGYVWSPVVTASEWSPYRVGRWVWMKGDYVWVSYEPWGWVPYHYGRWAFVTRIGWCWVPPTRGDVFWAPGYVAWVQTPTYVAWVPLAPREVYYGRGYHGAHSFDSARSAPPRQGQQVVYRNTYVTNAVTTVHRETFLGGRPAEARVKENPFTKERPSFGAPQIPPSRASVMPIVKEVPRGKEPPERFRRGETDRSRTPNGLSQTMTNRAPQGTDRGRQGVPQGTEKLPSSAPGAAVGGPVGSPTRPQEGVVRYGNPDTMSKGRNQTERPNNRFEGQPPATQPKEVVAGPSLNGPPKPVVQQQNQSTVPPSQENRRIPADRTTNETIRPSVVGQPKPVDGPPAIPVRPSGIGSAPSTERRMAQPPVSAATIHQGAGQAPSERVVVPSSPPIAGPKVVPVTPKDAVSTRSGERGATGKEMVPSVAKDRVLENSGSPQTSPRPARQPEKEGQERREIKGSNDSQGRSEKDGDKKNEKENQATPERERPGSSTNSRPQFGPR